MPSPLDVICVGAANLDTIARVDHVPADDERITTESFTVAGGGPAATAAVALARLGVSVGICSVIGDDAAGRTVRALLEHEGVDTTWLRVDVLAQTPQAVVLAARDTGARSIITTVATEPRPDEVPVGAAGWLHVDQTGFRSTRLALGESGASRLSVDAGNPIPEFSAAGVDLYVPTVTTLLARYGTNDIGEALAAARREGAGQIVATAGSGGTYFLGPDGVEHVAAAQVEVDSTIGAGDVFHGAVLAALVRGQALGAAIRSANGAAALACTRLDGRSGIPTWPDLQAFLKDDDDRHDGVSKMG